MKYWKRLVCRFTDHEMVALIRWSLGGVCLHIICNRCNKELGHLDVPTPTPKKESLH